MYWYSHMSRAFSQLRVSYSVFPYTWITTLVYPLFTGIAGEFPLFASSTFCDTRWYTYMYSRLCKWSNTRRSNLFSSLLCRCLEQVNSWASDHFLTIPSSIQLDWAIGSGPKNAGSSLLTRASATVGVGGSGMFRDVWLCVSGGMWPWGKRLPFHKS